MDFISGSYDPGDVYLFRGLGEGEYAKGESIKDEDDVPLVHHPEEFKKYQELKAEKGEPDSDEATTARVSSFGSWAAMVDWDDDGDLDILIGSFGGKLYRRMNVGTRSEPEFSAASIEVEVDGEPLKENCHANPVIADWDGDGLWDLVVGSGDGSVGWYKNTGSASKPEFGSRNLLVTPARQRSPEEQPGDAAMNGKFLIQNLKEGEEPIPAARAQICVHDYNRDGKLDLIVGDYSDINWTRELSDEEEKEMAEMKDEMKVLSEDIKDLQEKLYGEEVDEENKEENQKKYSKIVQNIMKIDGEMKEKFYDGSGSASHVWLYLRKGDATATYTGSKTDSSLNKDKSDEKDSQSKKKKTVDASVSIEPVAGENDKATHVVNIQIDVKSGWHLYEKSTSGSKVVSLQIEEKDGVQPVGDWIKPDAMMSTKNPADKIYVGSVAISRKVKVDSGTTGKLDVTLEYQVCNEKMCLPPTKQNVER